MRGSPTSEIRASGVTVDLGGAPILRGVDLHVEPGEFVGLIGPNGSGKSTFLKTLYRALRPSGGAVLLRGEPLGDMTPKQSARRLAALPQTSSMEFDFTVRDVVMMGRAPHKRMFEADSADDYAIAERALDEVGLAGFATRKFRTLSGGEKQRVLIARAIAQEPSMLVLDEPTNHLDVKYQIQLMELVSGLDMTVLAAMHDLNIAARYCDRIYVLSGGAVVASGTPEEVLTPQLIGEVFGVRAKVFREEETGNLTIVYLGA